MPRGQVSFLIVGSPRSGTTLVQRLARELPGVAVPFETHFFTKGVPVFVEHGGFPVSQPALGAALSQYLQLPTLDGAELNVSDIVAQLGTEPVDALRVFDAVTAIAAGSHHILGEKTPGHLHWATRLLALRPSLRVIGVVRDPRAVLASRRGVPWSGSSLDAQAIRWVDAQREVNALVSKHPDRTLVLRYEDVVADPDRARTQIADLLGVVPGSPARSAAPPLGLEWEYWKDGSDGTITEERVERWRDELTEAEAERITTICAPMLDQFGYARDDVPHSTWARIRVTAQGRRRRVQVQRRIHHEKAFVAGLDLGRTRDG